MEKLSIRGHEITVVGYNQLWRTEGDALFSRRRIFHHVSRFYENVRITFIRAGFVRLPILDYVSFLFSSRKEVKEAIDRFTPDVVVGFTSVLSNYWGMRFAKKRNIPFIYYWTDVVHTLIPFKLLHPIARIIEKRILKNSSKVITINDNLKDYVISLGADPSVTQVLPGGVDFNHFDPIGINPRPIREEYGISEDDLVLFYMGWIYAFSGLKEMVLGLSRNKDAYASVKLMIVGEGDYYPQLKEITELERVQDRVILTGERPYKEIPQLIAAADICLLPAHNNEIMSNIVPIKMYEYLAMYKPVIATKLPGVMKEFGQENGVIYVDKPEDVLRKAIELGEEDVREKSLEAAEFIGEFGWDRIVSRFEEVLRLLIRQG